jgi:hypothetical protein
VPTGCRLFRFRRVHKGSVGWLKALAVAVTSHRVLFFGLRNGWLDLVDAPARRDVELVEEKTGRWRGGDHYVDVLILRVRDQQIGFSLSPAWAEPRAIAARELTPRGTDPSPAQASRSQ